jgi:hypothetical protein
MLGQVTLGDTILLSQTSGIKNRKFDVVLYVKLAVKVTHCFAGKLTSGCYKTFSSRLSFIVYWSECPATGG